jgi:very-short-patch-repair endonuclease
MMKGYRFTRQRPVMNYIADFMCKELMLVIEVDGLTHDFKDVQDKDATNKKTLKEQVILYCDLQIMKCCLILRVLE